MGDPKMGELDGEWVTLKWENYELFILTRSSSIKLQVI